MNPRGPLSLRRMSAHWVVLAAAALTALVAAAVAAALAVFAFEALPQAVRHDLVVAQGTSMDVSGTFAGGSPAQTSAALPLDHRRDAGRRAVRLLAGHLVRPARIRGRVAARRSRPNRPTNTPLLQAASLQGVTDHAVLVSGRWPWQAAASSGGSAASGEGGGEGGREGAIPAALPANAAALLGLHTGGRPPRGWTGTPTRR